MAVSVSWLAAVAMPFVAAAAVVRLMMGPGVDDRPIRFTGNLTFDDYEQMIEHTFDVPEGVSRIDVTLSYTGKDRRTVLDLGLRGPSGPRGWSGGREASIHVSPLTATQGYLPGDIEPGRWSVILGVPNIRRDSRDSYSLVVTLGRGELLQTREPLRPGSGWYAGDLHLHSGHSDGRSASLSGAAMPAPVHRVLDRAAESGLDFAVLTDHNTAAHWLDVDRLQPYYDKLLLLHGREITTYRGHANAVGERRFADFTLSNPNSRLVPMLRGITRDGAFLSINHPRRPDDETCMGCGWNDESPEVFESVHGVEAVNGADWKTELAGWPFWAEALNNGARLSLIGGSDDHTPDNSADSRPGSPTTVVFASDLSETAIVTGLKSGRTYVRVRDANGPVIAVSACAEGKTYGLGDTIPVDSTTIVAFEAIVTRAPGQTLQWIRRGEPIESVDLKDEGVVRLEIRASPGDWFSVNVVDADGPTLMTGAIYTE